MLVFVGPQGGIEGLAVELLAAQCARINMSRSTCAAVQGIAAGSACGAHARGYAERRGGTDGRRRDPHGSFRCQLDFVARDENFVRAARTFDPVDAVAAVLAIGRPERVEDDVVFLCAPE